MVKGHTLEKEVEQHLLLIILIGGKYNLPIIEQFIHSTFSFVSSDPQKYKGYDGEGKHKSSLKQLIC